MHAYGGENVKKELAILIVAFVVAIGFSGAVAAADGQGYGNYGNHGYNHDHGMYNHHYGSSWWWRHHHHPWWWWRYHHRHNWWR